MNRKGQDTSELAKNDMCRFKGASLIPVPLENLTAVSGVRFRMRAEKP